MAQRLSINNKIKNGFATFVPPFTAATPGGRWVDGTSGGGSVDVGYNWYCVTGIPNAQYSILPGILKIEVTDATGRGRFLSGPGMESNTTLPLMRQYGIPLLPSTSYTFSYKVRTTNVVASAVRAEVITFNGAGTVSTTYTPGNTPAGTSDGFVTYSVTFTTSATQVFCSIRPGIFASGQVQTAEFSELKLDTTTPSARTTTNSRVVTRNMGTALRSLGAASDTVSIPHNNNYNFASTGATIVAWVKRNEQSLATRRAIHKRNGNTGFLLQTRTNGDWEWGVGVGGSIVLSTCNLSGGKSGQWNMIGLVLSGTSQKVYVNGVLVSSNTSGAISDATTTPLNLIGDGGNAVIGIMDEFRMWNRPFTDTDISDLYLNNIVPRTDLVAEYLFNEGVGNTAFDTSGNGNNGTITGATYTSDTPLKPRPVVRDMGTALKFNGAGDRVETTLNINTEEDFSRNLTVFSYGSQIPDALLMGDRGNDIGLIFDPTSNNFAFVHWNTGGTKFLASQTRQIQHQQFQNYTLTYVGSTKVMSLYRDGILVARNILTGTARNNAGFLTIGAANTGLRPFLGIIDTAREWNRALSDQEVSDLYFNNIVPRNGLVAEYLFNEASGTTALDTSGNGNNGIITGATYTLDTPLKPRSLA